MADDLPDDEREALEKFRAEKKKAAAKAREGEGGDVWEHPDGSHGARLEGARYTTWLRKKFPGIFDDLEPDEEIGDVTVSDDPNPPGKEDKPRMIFNRRVG